MTEDDTFELLKRWSFETVNAWYWRKGVDLASRDFDGEFFLACGWTTEEYYHERNSRGLGTQESYNMANL